MKRLRDDPSTSFSVEHKKAALRHTIESLTASDSYGCLTNEQAAIRPTGMSREVHFVHKLHAMHCLLTKSKGETSKVQCNRNDLPGKGSSQEHKDAIERLEKRVEELERQTEFRQTLVPDVDRRAVLRFPETKLVGKEFEKSTVKIMGWLNGSEAYRIGVHGMGGVGKTALLKHIYNKLVQCTGIICQPYWVTASQCDSVYKLQGSIAKCFGLDLSDEEHEMERAMKLYSRLTERENIVLILDDMWQPFCPNEVGIPVGQNGCKIILTTRLLEICRRMECGDFVSKVDLLHNKEAQDLFIDELGSYDKLTEEVKEQANWIVRKCHRLPLALITMARLMIGVADIHEWRSVSNELSIGKQIDMKDKVFSKLQISYDSLNDEMVQSCFLSFVVQSCFLRFVVHAHQVEGMWRSELITHWMEEGLMDELGDYKIQLSKGSTIINKLVDSCLFEDKNTKIYFHDLTRKMAIQMAESRIMLKHNAQIEEVPEEELWSKDLEHVSLLWSNIKKIPADMSPKCPKLRVLNMEGNPLVEVPESFFMHMKALTLLNLSQAHIESLPNSVSNLTNLRILKLRNCKKLAHVPSLAKLSKLKVLDLWGVSNVQGEVHMGIEKLKLLEELNFTWSSDWAHFSSVMESWPYSSLRKCNLLFQKAPSNVPHPLLLACDRCLTIVAVDLSSEKVVQRPGQIESLELRYCIISSIGDVLPASASSGHPTKLKHISLIGCKGVEYMFSAAKAVLCNSSQPVETVESLTIDCSDDLRGLIQLEDHETPHLPAAPLCPRHLIVIRCRKLSNLVSLNSLQSLQCFPNLETLSLKLCDKLLELISIQFNENDDSVAHNYTVDVPNLRVLELCCLPNLEGTVCRGLQCSSLNELAIWECNRVREVFSLDLLRQPHSLFPSLTRMSISYCENVEVIFSSSNSGGTTNPILLFPSLQHLTLSDLPKLGSIYRGVLFCTDIQELRVFDCPKYEQVKGLSEPVICDAPTLASLPSYDSNTDWWEPLKDFPLDTRQLSDLADQRRTLYWKFFPPLERSAR